MKTEVVFYELPDGREPAKDFLDSLDNLGIHFFCLRCFVAYCFISQIIPSIQPDEHHNIRYTSIIPPTSYFLPPPSLHAYGILKFFSFFL